MTLTYAGYFSEGKAQLITGDHEPVHEGPGGGRWPEKHNEVNNFKLNRSTSRGDRMGRVNISPHRNRKIVVEKCDY